MAKKKEIELPKLPFGMGNYDWTDETHTTIRYRKTVTMNGKTKRVSVYGSSISEVNQLMKAKETETEKELKIDCIPKLTLEKQMSEWLELYKKEEVNERTYDRNESTFLTHIANTDFGRMQLNAIKSDHVQEFMVNLKKHDQDGTLLEEPLSYSSRKKVYELLNQFFKYKYVKDPTMNPMLMVTKPKRDNEEQLKSDDLIIYDDDEMMKLTEMGMKPYRIGIEGYKHGSAIIFIMWTFVRLGEALALQWKDIDFSTNTIKISKSYSRSKIRSGAMAGQYEYKITPTKNKQTRIINMCAKAVDAIKYYKSTKTNTKPNDYVFGVGTDNKIISVNSISNMYWLMASAAGLDVDKHVTIHGLRHTGISYFIRHGVPIEVVSKLAGHKSIQITTDIYYQVIEQQKAKSIQNLDALMRL